MRRADTRVNLARRPIADVTLRRDAPDVRGPLPGPRLDKRPVTARMMTIRRIRPSPPLGKYPQLELYGHNGSAPRRSRTRMTSRIVLIVGSLPETYL
jgi:hypothetical protein